MLKACPARKLSGLCARFRTISITPAVDKAYVSTKVRDPQNLADAWDLTWLTALNVNLLHFRRGKRRRRLGR